MTRLTASASNIANANSIGATAGGNGPAPYSPVRAVQGNVAGGGVTSHIVSAARQALSVHEPGLPFADAQGMVAMPDVNMADEMVETLAASIAFQANARVLGTVHALERRVIDQLA